MTSPPPIIAVFYTDTLDPSLVLAGSASWCCWLTLTVCAAPAVLAGRHAPGSALKSRVMPLAAWCSLSVYLAYRTTAPDERPYIRRARAAAVSCAAGIRLC
jgi:hypothetical protein